MTSRNRHVDLSSTANICQLCNRKLKQPTTKHHLIPRRCHKNKWFRKRFTREQMQHTISFCVECHSAVHRFVENEKELGREYNTLDKLLAHPEIAKFVTWIRKQA